MPKYSNLEILSGGIEMSVTIQKIERIENSSCFFVFVKYANNKGGAFLVKDKSSEEEVKAFLDEVKDYPLLDPTPIGCQVQFTNGNGDVINGLCTEANSFEYILISNGTKYYPKIVEVLE